MKTYNEILKDIEKARKALKAAKEKEDALINEIHSAAGVMGKIEARRANNAEIIKNAQKITDLNITIKILKNNARVALFNEITPVIIEMLKKYAGKPYGEKTRDKISDEIKSATGCRCYISERWSTQEINIYSDIRGYDITIGYRGNSDAKILIDNKIQAPPETEQMQLYYIKNVYFENIPAAIKETKKAYQKAVEKQKELEKICNDFNYYAVEGIERIYKDKYINAAFRG